MRGDGPAPKARDFTIEKASDALDDLVAPNAKLELVADGFGLNEGPVWVRDGDDGYLILGGLLDNALYKITPDKERSEERRVGKEWSARWPPEPTRKKESREIR